MGLIFLCIGLPVLLGPFYPNAARRYWKLLRGDEDHLLQRDSAGWHTVELPGIPYEIQTSSEGDVWVATQDPNGLSHWSGGRWTHYSRPGGPNGGFAVSGRQAWEASDQGGLDHFDGTKWIKLPAHIAQPMATAAEGNEVWVINGYGMLTHCDGDQCDSHSVTQQIHDSGWGSQTLAGRARGVAGGRRNGYKTLVRTQGRLWFIHNTAWYSSDGQEWTEWKETRYVRNWSRGPSGGRIWLGTSDSLIGIGDDLLAAEFPLDSLGGGAVYGVHAGDGHIRLAGGGRGVYEHTEGTWRPVPIDAAFHSEDVRGVASTPDGQVWIITSRLFDARGMFVLGGVILAALVFWNVRAMRKESEDPD